MKALQIFGGVGAALMALVIVIGLVVGLYLLGHQIRRWVAPIEGETGVQEFRNSTENRIVRYEHFFNLCASVQTHEARIDQFTSELTAYDVGTQDYSRVQANLSAAIIARADAVNQYNADALKDYTGAEFRDSDLPYQLSSAGYQAGEGHTQCAA